ncbi:MAG: tyrosine-type recombinase/integrase [bacterium]
MALRAEVNAEGRPWHTLRHTYARRFVEAGARLEEFQHSLGHSSIRTTSACDGHFTDACAASTVRLRICCSAAGEPPRGSKWTVGER